MGQLTDKNTPLRQQHYCSAVHLRLIHAYWIMNCFFMCTFYSTNQHQTWLAYFNICTSNTTRVCCVARTEYKAHPHGANWCYFW